MSLRLNLVLAVAAGFGASVFAQPDPSGIDFVTIGAPGNAPWAGNGTEGDMAIGRGRVDYEYRIGRLEITTAQWVEFFNAAYDRPDASLPHLFPPDHWGAAATTPDNPGRQRWTVPTGSEMRPVGDISWRMAAMYCNWLHNGKSSNREAFLNGAYDVSTFGFQGNFFTDQLTHHPDARYWIPTWDEWLKAAHYDPNKANPDGTTGGWWVFPNGSDARPRYGPPGVLVTSFGATGPDPDGVPAQANADWNASLFPGHNPFSVPLGDYPTVQSPWGLLDVAGGTSEWTEYAFLTQGTWPRARGADGSAWTTSWGADWIYALPGDFPNTATFDYGFRVAAVIPTPGACLWIMWSYVLLCGLRPRKGDVPQLGVQPPSPANGYNHDFVTLLLDEYGGVFADYASAHALQIRLVDPNDPLQQYMALENWITVTVTLAPGQHYSRRMQIVGNGVTHLSPGHVPRQAGRRERGRLHPTSLRWHASVHGFDTRRAVRLYLRPAVRLQPQRDRRCGGDRTGAGDVQLHWNARRVARGWADRWLLPRDVNCDGAINGFDVEGIEEAVNGDFTNFCVYGDNADFNMDGAINGFDVEAVESAVNGTCPWDTP